MSDSDRKRLPPVDGTTRELYLYSGNQCAFTGCTEVLLNGNGSWNCEVAHIYGVKPDSARGDHSLTNEQLREPSNLVLMCRKHHAEIDNKKMELTYTVEVVQEIKAHHEAKYRTALLGLERIVDSTAGDIIKRPRNLCALDGFCDNLTDDEIRENVAMAAPFVDALAKQPAALRDLIALVLIHGDVENFYGCRRVLATTTRIEAVASSITPEELARRARSLEHDGLLSIEEDEGIYFLLLVDPTAKHVGWDLFVAIRKFAGSDSRIVRKIIDSLDFTVLDA